MIFKKTKIVATIGPVTESAAVLTQLIDAGMNVCRLNFSHGDHGEHTKRLKNIRSAATKTGATIAVLQDLSGPKIRIGDFAEGKVTVKAGASFTLSTKKRVGDVTGAYVNYPTLHKEVKVGQFILLDDGRKKFRVESIKGNDIHCKVIVGGEMKGRRGVNIPGAYLKVSSLTEKDREDLVFGIKNKVDFMALSFVRRAEDVIELREILNAKKAKHIAIIAKIETQEAIDCFDEILQVADGGMVARGDLAVEVPAEQVPVYQKMIVSKANAAGKPVIVATQMLESMIKSPVATRAEVSDVANSIFDGADAVMLSEETTLGEFPVEAVSLMSRIAETVEGHYPHDEILAHEIPGGYVDMASGSHLGKDVVDSVTFAAARTAFDVEATVIVALTESGFTAQMLSRFRPSQPIIVMSPNAHTVGKMALSFGCYPAKIKSFTSIAQVVADAKKYLLANKLVKKGDRVVFSMGVPFGKVGGTNLVLVEVM